MTLDDRAYELLEELGFVPWSQAMLEDVMEILELEKAGAPPGGGQIPFRIALLLEALRGNLTLAMANAYLAGEDLELARALIQRAEA
jgi:hypothetical protein